MIRHVVERLCASYYRLRYRGKVSGSAFIIRKPSLLRIKGGGRLIVGDHTTIDKDARIVVTGADLVIGARAFIGKNSTLVAFASLELGNEVLLGENVSIHTEDHGPANNRGRYTTAPVHIGSRVWLGAGVVVTKGVSIGRNTTVGANAVVTRDLPSDVTAVGAPARALQAARTRDAER